MPGVVRSWAFLRRPFWLFSHVFVGSMIVFCVWAMVWQIGRHGERRDLNAVVATRLDQEPLDNAGLLAALVAVSDPAELEFVPVGLEREYLEADFVRVVNRSANGLPVEWVVVRLQLDEGPAVVLNTGFLGVDEEAPVRPDGVVTVRGWLRTDEEKSLFGVTDDGMSLEMPRLSVGAVESRTMDGVALLPGVWVQRADADGAATGPTAVPLPPADGGPHRSYAVQWAVFATLTAIFYAAILRRRARDDGRAETISGA